MFAIPALPSERMVLPHVRAPWSRNLVFALSAGSCCELVRLIKVFKLCAYCWRSYVWSVWSLKTSLAAWNLLCLNPARELFWLAVSQAPVMCLVMCEMLISGNFLSHIIYIREGTDSARQGEAPRPLPQSQPEMFSSFLTQGGVLFHIKAFWEEWASKTSGLCLNVSVEERESSSQASECLARGSVGAQRTEAWVALAQHCPCAGWVLSAAPAARQRLH